MEGGAVAVFLELLPGLEDVPGDLEAVQAERLLRSQSELGVEGEVAAQVRPAHLPAGRVEAVVGDEAVGADDPSELIAEQRVQMLLAPAGRDPQHGGALPEGAPERAQLAGEIPAGLVDVERAGRTGLLE